MRLSDAVLSLVTVAAEIFVLSGAIWGQTTRSQAVTQYVSETTGKTIDQLVESALKNNGDLRSTRQRIAEAQGLLTQSRLRINPTLDASFGNGRVVNSPGERAFGIGYAHTFELGAKRDRRVAVADLGALRWSCVHRARFTLGGDRCGHGGISVCDLQCAQIAHA